MLEIFTSHRIMTQTAWCSVSCDSLVANGPWITFSASYFSPNLHLPQPQPVRGQQFHLSPEQPQHCGDEGECINLSTLSTHSSVISTLYFQNSNRYYKYSVFITNKNLKMWWLTRLIVLGKSPITKFVNVVVSRWYLIHIIYLKIYISKDIFGQFSFNTLE